MQYRTLKKAFELNPYSTGQMALLGGGAAGLAGLGIGALAGGEDTAQRRKRMLIGALVGGGAGTLAGTAASRGLHTTRRTAESVLKEILKGLVQPSTPE